MFRTRVTEMFGIKYPIIQGGLQWISYAELAAAVSNAGGLGMIASVMFTSPQTLRDEIRKMRHLTDKPFGVNITLFTAEKEMPVEKYIDTVLEEGVTIVETAGRNPEAHLKRLKAGGATIIHKVPTVRFALTAERLGADAVAILGCEGAGHVGLDEVSSLVLIPQAADALKIPVIAAGGIGDARGLVAALAAGADGVLMGTRFMLSQESILHPKVKEWLLEAKEMDTMLVQRSLRNTVRARKNSVAQRVMEMESKGATFEELWPLIRGTGSRDLITTGNTEAGILSCGQVIGLIHDLPPIREIIDNIVGGASTVGRRLHKMGILPS